MSVFADADHLSGGHEVTVAGRHRPLGGADAEASAAALEVGEHEEVVDVGMSGFDPLHGSPIEACDRDRRDPRCRFISVHRWRRPAI
jgi:hypothetical protein